MSEKKYHVYNKMSSLFLKDKNFPHVLEISDKDYSQAKFTKAELTEIMDGALYKQTNSLPFEWLYSFESLKEKLGWEFNETIDKWEYTNPIIELVPVETNYTESQLKKLTDKLSVEKLQEQLNTAKKYIEHVIGTIKHDGHLGTIQTDWILPDLENALSAIGNEGSGDE
jgi:hypothetical protein